MLPVVALVLAMPATAAAAVTKPVVTTGGASPITPTTAVLHGSVNPKGSATNYFFQYAVKGTPYAGGARTPDGAAGGSSAAHSFTATIGGLAPATAYRYRIAATNAKGQVFGKTRNFTTRRQPLGVSLGGVPNPVRTGSSTTLTGVLSGTGNANRQVTLLANPFPYTQGFVAVANNQVTNATGGFAFPVLALNINTQYKVVMPAKPTVQSPIVFVGTKLRVTTHVHVTRGTHRGAVRFSGSLLPASDGTAVAVQKFVHDKWTTIGTTSARHASSSRSSYRKTVHQRHAGRYRVVELAQGAHVPNVGRSVRVHHVTF